MLDTSIQVKTDHFDGPLSLLLLLIQKEEMNIAELDLTKVTQQYLNYLSEMRDLNFDVAGEYLFLAATLILLKSKTFLSMDETGELANELQMTDDLHITSQSDLIRRLEELKHFQEMGARLWGLEKKGHTIFTRPKIDRKVILNSILTPMDLEKLTMTMINFLFRQKRKFTIIRRDRLSIKEKLKFLKEKLVVGQNTSFEDLLALDEGVDDQRAIDNIVITFISLLELARLRRIHIFQNVDCSNIYINVVRDLGDFDIDQANGFDDETEGGDLEKVNEKEAEISMDRELERIIVAENRDFPQ